MAIMVEAGPPATMGRSTGEGHRLEIRQISIADLIECIEKGVKDFTRSSKYGMFFGAFYAVGGALIVWLAVLHRLLVPRLSPDHGVCVAGPVRRRRHL